ncbi:putative non-ribosomal peptide synthase [Burkholderia pseudomallei MSHR5569]|nr:putative non-ribosomal peptide synthase [Burkholderia pseudomallei MSHR5569]
MRSGGSFSTCESLSRRYACIRSGACASPGCGGEAAGGADETGDAVGSVGSSGSVSDAGQACGLAPEYAAQSSAPTVAGSTPEGIGSQRSSRYAPSSSIVSCSKNSVFGRLPSSFSSAAINAIAMIESTP